ncbi:MAG TPA: Coenzyme F420 hydrogenase/dehydrogenase, beta subunit C-terminal domain [Clostridiales bacterium]|nr:Coenzyme F420 hydrogenase/dehydrogenase, beta subunit C-terminal domain [Clostridiales bacterium]
MTEDQWGCIYPLVDEKHCTRCGVCAEVCPEHNRPNLNTPVKCYAMYSPYKKDMASSSGGAATVLGRCVIQKNGVVFGTVYDKEGTLVYNSAKTEPELEQFRGSKYVYAYLGRTYQQIHELLSNGVTCLIVATPCHIAGLRAFFRKDWPNLYTLDLICHGTPPMRYLRQHTENVTHSRRVNRVTFRGINNYYLSAYERNKKIYSKRGDEDAYFSAFMNGLTFRENCYQCPYAQIQRVGDLTIGDFWGLDKDTLDGYPGKPSVILVNTEKGDRMLSWIEDVVVMKQSVVDKAIQGNSQLIAPTTRHPHREVFRSSYLQNGFSGAIRDTDIPDKMRVAKMRNMIIRVPRYIRNRRIKRKIQTFMRQE